MSNVVAILESSDLKNAVRSNTKMNDQCSDLTQNSGKLEFSNENLNLATEINSVTVKEPLLNFPFDHMYACNSDNSELNSDKTTGESEVRELKELLLIHLDLIQQQSEQIVNKDKIISKITKENEMLRQRIERMERRVTLKNNHLNSNTISNSLDNHTLSKNMTHDSAFSGAHSDSEDCKANIQLLEFSDSNIISCSSDKNNANNNNVQNRQSFNDSVQKSTTVRCFSNRSSRLKTPPLNSKLREELTKPIQPKSTKLNSVELMSNNTISKNNLGSGSGDVSRPNSCSDNRTTNKHRRRKRNCSENSMLSNNSSVTDSKKHKNHTIKRDSVLTTGQMYYTHVGERENYAVEESVDLKLENSPVTKNLEVPSWRVKVFTSCYAMEGTENLDDDVFNKRHSRHENDERRRKRWDVQRIREQRLVEKLKQRQERIESGLRPDENPVESPTTLWPSLDDIKYIEITDKIPVSAFGFPIAEFLPSEFTLTWFNTNAISPKKVTTRTKKSIARRKSTKR